jgi:hypothetical protein
MHASVQCKVGVNGSVGRSCDPWNVAPCKLITVLWPLVALGDWTPGSWRMPPCQAKMLAGARPTPCLALIFCSTCSVYHQSPRCCIGLFKHIYACKIYQGSLLQNIPHQGFYYVIIYTSVFYRGEASQEQTASRVFTLHQWRTVSNGTDFGKKKKHMHIVCNRVGGLSRSSQSTKQIIVYRVHPHQHTYAPASRLLGYTLTTPLSALDRSLQRPESREHQQ